MTDRPTDEEIADLHLLCQAANPGGDYEVMRLGFAAREWLPRLIACITELEAAVLAEREACIELIGGASCWDRDDLIAAIRALDIPSPPAERDAAYVTGWNEATRESLLKEDALRAERDRLVKLAHDAIDERDKLVKALIKIDGHMTHNDYALAWSAARAAIEQGDRASPQNGAIPAIFPAG